MRRKKGIELSINVLIVVILSIAILVMGIVFFNKFLTGAEKIRKGYDQRTAEELENLLVQGEKVAIPFPKQDARKGDTVIFGLGIYNSMKDEPSYEFRVNVQCSTAFKEKTEHSEYCTSYFSGGDNIVYNQNDLTIKNNERHKMPIAITFPKNVEEGTYIFNVCVCYGAAAGTCQGSDTCKKDPDFPTNLHDPVHKMYVTVG